MTDEIDAKLARLGERVRARTGDVRAQLESIGALELADALRESFAARLLHLVTPSGEWGRRPDWLDLPSLNGVDIARESWSPTVPRGARK